VTAGGQKITAALNLKAVRGACAVELWRGGGGQTALGVGLRRQDAGVLKGRRAELPGKAAAMGPWCEHGRRTSIYRQNRTRLRSAGALPLDAPQSGAGL